jgi:hypothetical protein
MSGLGCPAAGNGRNAMAASSGYIMLNRTDETIELIGRSTAEFKLLSFVALRAYRGNGFNRFGLQPGEALLGDHAAIGLTRQEYRTALKNLQKSQFITVKTTNKGTIAKLLDSRVYDINVTSEQPARQPSSNQQATIEQPLTISKEVNNGNKHGFDGVPKMISDLFTNETALLQFAANCDHTVEIMTAYLDYARKQIGVDNPTGLAIKLASERIRLPETCSVSGCRLPKAKFTTDGRGGYVYLCQNHYAEYKDVYPNGNGQMMGEFVRTANAGNTAVIKAQMNYVKY